MTSKKNTESKANKASTEEKMMPFELRDGYIKLEKLVYNRKTGNKIGSVYHSDYNDSWSIREWPEPYEFMARERIPSFKTADEAAVFLWNVIICSNKLREAVPVPQVVFDYISNEIRDLRPMMENARNIASQAYIKKRSLRHFAKHLGLENLFYELNEEDNRIKDLLDFKINHQGEEISFFSEGVLYDLIGKDDARTVLALLRRLIEKIDPVAANEL